MSAPVEGMRWQAAEFDRRLARRLQRELNLSRPAAEILARLGVNSSAEARGFLDPKLASLQDPFAIANLEAAVQRLRRAMRDGEEILVFGDYDVDGVTSTVILVDVLTRYGIYPRFVVPKRLEEGYGLSEAALKRAITEGGRPDLLIAVDCGTSSRAEVALLRSAGIDVIILDHHTSKESLPEDCLVVNPHVHDPEDAPWKHLCAVGLVFKFIHGLLKALREDGDDLAHEIRLRDYLDLVTLGTIADLVPLIGENRVFVRHGLKLLRETRRVGLAALFEVGGIQLGSEITPFDISFRIGPRINASGRLGDASEPIKLLLGADLQECRQTAMDLDASNRDRQAIERAIAEEAESRVKDAYGEDPGIILFHPEWHAGVVGIVASRLTNRFHRPALVLGAEGGLAKGSGRSVPGINLVEVLKPCADLLENWGGHPMAVGLTVDPANIEKLREAFCASILRNTAGELPEPIIEIAAELDPKELNEQLLHDLDHLAPFGQGNEEPVFSVRNAVIDRLQPIGDGSHTRFHLVNPGNGDISGVAWNRAADLLPHPGTPCRLALRFGWNVWQGRRTPRVTFLDWEQPGL